MSCRGVLKCTLKAFNFILTLVGAAMILYSIWMLKKWHSHIQPPLPSPPTGTPPSPEIASPPLPFAYDVLFEIPKSSDLVGKGQKEWSENGVIDESRLPRFLLRRTSALDLQFTQLPHQLPAPWFIYTFLGMGIVVCLITCCGHIASETANGCCLSCYTVFLCLLIVLEAAIAAFVFLNHHWEQDIPDDPTGQFDNLKNFVEENFDICKWVGLVVLVVQALAILISMILRALGPVPQGSGYDSDDDYVPPRSGMRQPLLGRQTSQGVAASTTGADVRPPRGDAWTARMREKYGLDTTEFTYSPTDSKRFSATYPTLVEEKSRKCTVM
eukprot:c4546_g1_i1 orf=337-1317(-)